MAQPGNKGMRDKIMEAQFSRNTTKAAEEVERRQRIQLATDRDQARRIAERDRAQTSHSIDLNGPVEP